MWVWVLVCHLMWPCNEMVTCPRCHPAVMDVKKKDVWCAGVLLYCTSSAIWSARVCRSASSLRMSESSAMMNVHLWTSHRKRCGEMEKSQMLTSQRERERRERKRRNSGFNTTVRKTVTPDQRCHPVLPPSVVAAQREAVVLQWGRGFNHSF